MNTLSILLVGDITRDEFAGIRATLDRWAAVSVVGDVEAAAAALAEGDIVPDAIVVAQSFPGQFSHTAIDRLRRLAPLARILGLMGSWCEGEMRSGSPWPSTARIYWHQWPAHADRQFHQMAAGQACSWTLPPTATEEERLLADLGPLAPGEGVSSMPTKGTGSEPRTETPARDGCREVPVPLFQQAVRVRADELSGPPGGLVVIRSPSTEMAEWLSAACRRRGLATLWQRASSADRIEGATAAIFDGADLDDDECGELKRLAAALGPAPVVALLSFPRTDTYDRARSAGAAAVLSKPVVLEDLFWQLHKVVGKAFVAAT
jgi:hypothetical protein